MTMSTHPTAQEVTILLAEDDAGHARLIEKNLRRANILNHLTHVETGQAALDFIFAAIANDAQQPMLPLLMLLDLNMPGMDGYQVLSVIKSDPRTKHIPVIILTTTEDPREVARCYDLGCNIYITKPVDYNSFTEAIGKLGLFLTIVTVPELE